VHQDAARHLAEGEATRWAASTGHGISLDDDLILSDMGIELFTLILRQSPILAWRWLTNTLPADAPLPFKPDSLRYDWGKIEQLRRHLTAGHAPAFHSRLPHRWKMAILDHLGLGSAEMAGKAASAPVRSEMPVQGPMAYLKALRIHQWSKNVLVFVPVLMSHQFLEWDAVLNALLAFFCFGLVASSIYLMNDMMDLQQDRKHPSKWKRPFASGAIPVRQGVMMFPLLVGLALFIASFLPPMFLVVMAIYFTLNLGYTFYLKRKLLVDVLALSGCYTLRILAGNAAGPIELSNWLLAFSMFLFLSLALVKRYVELDTVGSEQPDEKRVMGRGYRSGDLDMISQLGVASGFAAVIVLALFVEGAGKSGLYKHRELIWLVCPIVLYVIGRIWVLAKRQELPDDPIFFIITDWRSHLMGAIVALVFFFAV
jgi:4-hydroxybenzoate polyprenyltransferase